MQKALRAELSGNVMHQIFYDMATLPLAHTCPGQPLGVEA